MENKKINFIDYLRVIGTILIFYDHMIPGTFIELYQTVPVTFVEKYIIWPFAVTIDTLLQNLIKRIRMEIKK